MSSLSSGLGNAGSKLSFTHAGKTYEVSYLTQAVKASFESWIVGRALETLSRLRPILPPDEYAEEKTTLFDSIAAGRFGFHGDVCRAAMKTTDGNLAVVGFLFGCGADEMVTLVMERGEEIKALVEVIVQESSPKGSKKNMSARSLRRKEKKTLSTQTPSSPPSSAPPSSSDSQTSPG